MMLKSNRISLLGLGVCLCLTTVPVLAQGVYVSGDGSVVSNGALGYFFGAAGAGHSMAGGDMVMTDLKSPGALSSGRDVSCSACQISGNVAAGRNVSLAHSPQVGSIAAGHDVTVLDCQVLGSISAGHGASLSQSTVQGNLSAGHEADLEGSHVQGSLYQGGHALKLSASSVQRDIHFQGNSQQSVMSGQNSQISTQNGYSTVRVGEHSLSRLNGYTVQGAAQQTTVITPQQGIYVNGRKVSGDGPKTYAQFREAFPLAPVVEGPGWSEDANSSATSAVTQGKSLHQPEFNVLELTNNSVVNGQVMFESGYGKVVLHPGSRLVGQVVNGWVEKVAQ